MWNQAASRDVGVKSCSGNVVCGSKGSKSKSWRTFSSFSANQGCTFPTAFTRTNQDPPSREHPTTSAATARAQTDIGLAHQHQPHSHIDDVLGRLTQIRSYLVHALQAHLLDTINLEAQAQPPTANASTTQLLCLIYDLRANPACLSVAPIIPHPSNAHISIVPPAPLL